MANYEQPPKLIETFLRWTLPAELKEPLIGDLAEEFHDLQAHNTLTAKNWYMRQALRTANQFIWQTKRGLIMFLISILVFLFFSYMAMWFSVDGSMTLTFVDGPSLLLVFPPAILFAIGVTSIKDTKNALAVLFNDELQLSNKELTIAKQFYRVLGNSAILMGIFTTFIGAVAIAVNIENVAEEFGPAFGVCILVLLYGSGLKTLCYAAEQKVQYRINQASHELD